MAEDSTPSEPTAEDRFGPPHGHQVSDSLQLWILIPGALVIIVVVVYLLYRLFRRQGERERKRAEKKRLKQEKKKKK